LQRNAQGGEAEKTTSTRFERRRQARYRWTLETAHVRIKEEYELYLGKNATEKSAKKKLKKKTRRRLKPKPTRWWDGQGKYLGKRGHDKG